MARLGPVYEYGDFKGTVAEAARHFNINEQTLRTRMSRGYSFSQAISTPLRDLSFHIPSSALTLGTFRGTRADVFKRFGVRLHSYVKTDDEAIKKVQHWKKNVFYSIPEKNYKGSLLAIAMDFGCSYDKLKAGVTAGLTPAQILKDGGYLV